MKRILGLSFLLLAAFARAATTGGPSHGNFADSSGVGNGPKPGTVSTTSNTTAQKAYLAALAAPIVTPAPPPTTEDRPFRVSKVGETGVPETRDKLLEIFAIFQKNYTALGNGTIISRDDPAVPDTLMAPTQAQFIAALKNGQKFTVHVIELQDLPAPVTSIGAPAPVQPTSSGRRGAVSTPTPQASSPPPSATQISVDVKYNISW